ncbi:hypothetical protein EDB85DRAFT_2149173 [Lactarius pseudohatsudake]|nr:hypothetical protein EDB85DRAFT_2149173 [Lactarius pseudohatsudake]
MAALPSGQPPVDLIYNLLADIPTTDDSGDPLSLGKSRQALVVCFLTPPPSAFTKELEALWHSLNLRLDALQGVIQGSHHPSPPSAPVPTPLTTAPVSKPRAKKPSAQLPTPAPAKAIPASAPTPTPATRPTPPLFASVAKTPAWPSLVVSLRPPVAGHLATLSATRWTAKNNLVITAGPDTTVHHLTSASHLISDCLVTFLSTDQSPLPVQTSDNCKWARLLVNGIPTGASPTRGPYSPLNSMQPSWWTTPPTEA